MVDENVCALDDIFIHFEKDHHSVTAYYHVVLGSQLVRTVLE